MWLTLGDSNSCYFHAVTKGRKAINRLIVVETENGIPVYLKVICNFYSKLFKSNKLDGHDIVHEALQPCVTKEQNDKLIGIPSFSEIKEATFYIHPDKAPGPDGFSASFFQSNWDTVGDVICKEIQLFFVTGYLEPSMNKTFVRLIPKITTASKVEEYRPIALCNVYFKIILKLLSLRLKPVLSSIISEHQSAFIPARAISDNVLILLMKFSTS